MISNSADLSNILSKECPICMEEYENLHKKPMVIDCGHTICIDCLGPILRTQRQCPFDKKPLKQRLESYPVNWSFLEILISN